MKTHGERSVDALVAIAEGGARTQAQFEASQRELRFIAALLRGDARIWGRRVRPIEWVDGQPWGRSNAELAEDLDPRGAEEV